ncbi:carbonic anhydrase [Terriglobus sp.]|uniref:carbonic anhydrase n=1 Tax=Terriglobus sp. TaxID=1889013 RepID=UPI003B00D161
MSEHQDQALNRLKEGIHRFQSEVYPHHSAEYQYAASHPQTPHTLIITCADSRIDIETITGSNPGEIFVARNVGNMVPAYGEMLGGVSAVIEYAVSALKVKHAAICGHMDCGAMKALKTNDSSLDALPTVKSWLNNAQAARSVAASMNGGEPSLHTLTEQNVLLQLTHLQTHPSVRGAMARGELTISGWIYDIATGDVLIYSPATKKFESTLAAAGDLVANA